MTSLSVIEMSEKTADAYSFSNGAWSLVEWNKVIDYLRNIGQDDLEIEAILRSKHMRWCADEAESPVHGGATLKDFLIYFSNRRNGIGPKEIRELVKQTFGDF